MNCSLSRSKELPPRISAASLTDCSSKPSSCVVISGGVRDDVPQTRTGPIVGGGKFLGSKARTMASLLSRQLWMQEVSRYSSFRETYAYSNNNPKQDCVPEQNNPPSPPPAPFSLSFTMKVILNRMKATLLCSLKFIS